MHLFQNGNHPPKDIGDRGHQLEPTAPPCYNVRCENPSFAAGIDRRISHERPFEFRMMSSSALRQFCIAINE
jgi:hypothetical protein